MKKRCTALFMCFVMIFSLTVSAYAERKIDGTLAYSMSNAYTPSDAMTSSGGAYEKDNVATGSNAYGNSAVATGSNATTLLLENVIGRTGKLKSGTVVYEAADLESKSYMCLLSYDITIEDHFVVGENEWYRFSCDELLSNFFWKYRYVLADDVVLDPLAESAIKTEITNRLTELETQFWSLDGWDECYAFYEQMMDAYSLAFEEDILVISGEEMSAVDEQFGALKDALLEVYGFSNWYDYDAVYYDENDNPFTLSGTSAYKTSRNVEVLKTSENGESDVDGIENGKIYTSKSVSGTVGDYTLTLESYVTGIVRDIDNPSDIVLVLDQSASMYIPVGLPGYLTNESLYTREGVDVKVYTQDELQEAMEDNEADDSGLTFEEKAGQLGYLIAQSTCPQKTYCSREDEGHDHSHVCNEKCDSPCKDACKACTIEDENHDHDHTCDSTCEIPCKEKCNGTTYDWFIVQYVKDDPESKPWHMYRVPNCSTPSGDCCSWGEHRIGIEDNMPDLIKFESLSSESMGNYHFYFYKTQYGALYDAIYSFADGLAKTGVNHRLAVVGFSGELTCQKYGDGSGIYTENGFIRYDAVNENWVATRDSYDSVNSKKAAIEWIYSIGDITIDQYKQALVSVKSDYPTVKSIINTVKTDYYNTSQYIGMYMANQILQNKAEVKDDEGTRSCAIVLFTDGTPSASATVNKITIDSEQIANETINQANIAKSVHRAKVYTICTSTLGGNTTATDQNDTTYYYTDPEKKVVENVQKSDEVDVTAFLKYASSNYVSTDESKVTALPTNEDEWDAYMTNNYRATEDNQYFTKTTNAEQLLEAFESVSWDVGGTTSELDGTAIMQDTISSDFVLPSGLFDENGMPIENKIGDYVKVYTVNASAPDDAGNVTWEKDESGNENRDQFDDAEVVVSKNAAGQDVVQVKNFDYAENYVSTNGRGTEQFYGKKLVVDIKIVPSESNHGGNNLETNNSELSGIYFDGEKVANFDLPHVDVPVKITVKKMLESGPADAKFDFIADFVTFDDYSNSGSSGNSLTAVRKSVQNSDISLGDGESVTLEREITLNTGEQIQLGTAYVGSTITITEKDIERYNVTVKVGDEVKELKFDDKDCSVTLTVEPDMEIVFTNAVKLLDLIIEKVGADETLDPNQTFIFHVEGDSDDEFTKGKSWDVVINGNNQATIKGLWYGKYSVTEDSDWSWRYTVNEVKYDGKVVNGVDGVYTIDVVENKKKIVFNNDRPEDHWMDGNAHCKNIFNIPSNSTEGSTESTESATAGTDPAVAVRKREEDGVIC